MPENSALPTAHTRASMMKSILAVVTILALGACATTAGVPDAKRVKTDAQVLAASTWQAALPHGGSMAALAQWWTQWDDKLLTEVLEAAQKESASLSSATARIAQARAALIGAQSAALPGVNGVAQASRGTQALNMPVATSFAAGVQASWEIDLFGGNRAAATAAQLRLENAQLGWHEARVSVALETAAAYYDWYNCVTNVTLVQADATSRAETARLSQITAKAGLSPSATAALASASAADAANNLRAASAQCELKLKALVALTAMPEPALRQKLVANIAVAQKIADQDTLFTIASLPAEVLAQRPDIASAQRAVAAASADAAAADAKRYPVLSLNGNISAAALRQMGQTSDGVTWSIGPISLSLPIFDNGRNAANIQSAIAAYEDAVVALRSKARTAVREVEEALVTLESTRQRRADVLAASAGYKAAFDATQARYRSGLASLPELEDARRTALAAQQSRLALDRERIAAWVSLYRAAGGGWPINPTPATP